MRACFVLIVVLSACAFQTPREKGLAVPEAEASATPTPSGSPVVASSPEPSLPSASIRLAWWKDEKTKDMALTRTLDYRKAERLLLAPGPITVPVEVPDRIEVELSVPTRLAEITPAAIAVHWDKLGEKLRLLAPNQIQVSGQDQELTVVTVDLSGLRSLLNGSVQDQGELQVQIRRPSGEVALTIKQPLRTPPSLFVTEQGVPEAKDFEGLAEAELRKVEVGAGRWDMVTVLRIQNRSGAEVELLVPTSIDLVLRLFSRKIRHATGPCEYGELVTFPVEELARTNWVVPIAKDTQERLVALAGGGSGAAVAVRFAPANWTRLAVYVQGARVEEIATGRFTPRKLGTAKVNSRCDAKCDSMRMGSWEFPTCWASVAMHEGMDAAERERVPDCKACAVGKQDECNRCFHWERTFRRYRWRGPNCLFCGELKEVGRTDTQTFYEAVEQWRLESVEIEVPDGIEDLRAALTVERGDISMRWADMAGDADPSRRSAALWKPEMNF